MIDAHVPDRVNDEEDEIVDRILELSGDGKFQVLLPYSVKAEIEHPHTPAIVKRRAMSLIYTEEVALTEQELAMHSQIREIMRGNAKPGKHDADAYHIVESAKYGRYFITNDQRILQKRGEIADLLQIVIVTPREFLDAYERFASENV